MVFCKMQQNEPRGEVCVLAENLAQEIRDQETFAKNIITNAKSEAAKMLASAQTRETE